MRRRAAALLCATVLVCQAVVWPAKAADEICFIAVNSEVLPLSDATMPFWVNGYLYIPPAFLPGRCVRNWESIISGLRRTCPFCPAAGGHCCLTWKRGTVSDDGGNQLFPGGNSAGGEVFVPVTQVALFLGSAISRRSRGRLVQIYNDKAGLTGKSLPTRRSIPWRCDTASICAAKRRMSRRRRPCRTNPRRRRRPRRRRGKRLFVHASASGRRDSGSAAG